MAPSFKDHDLPRSLDQALADLRVSYQKRPTAALARMIKQLESEIAIRSGATTGQPTE